MPPTNATGQDECHQASRMRRRLKPSHLSVQEFPVAAVHIHLDPASLSMRIHLASICSAVFSRYHRKEENIPRTPVVVYGNASKQCTEARHERRWSVAPSVPNGTEGYFRVRSRSSAVSRDFAASRIVALRRGNGATANSNLVRRTPSSPV
jgi:hypothetical protein